MISPITSTSSGPGRSARSRARRPATGVDSTAAWPSRAINSPVGRLTLLAGPAGLRAILWPGEDGSRVARSVSGAALDAEPPDGSGPAQAHLDRAVAQLGEYFAGERTVFDLALDPAGSPFQVRVWAALREIPFGQTRTYAEQAQAIGAPNAARAVGAADGRNPLSIVVPCHRVLGGSGSLTGFAGGVTTKAWLLEHERSVLAR